MTLDEIRGEIDAIDEKLLPLLLARLDCAKQVAEIKRESGLPVLNAAREKEILDHAAARAGAYAGEARSLYAGLMDMSRALQHKMLGSGKPLREAVEHASLAPDRTDCVACLGKSGSFSHEALSRLYPRAEPLFCGSFSAIFQAVEDGRADLGIVPVENSLAGSVHEVYDLILKYRFSMIAAETLPVHLCLAALPGSRMETLQTVYSHPQPIAQCSGFIADHSLNAIPCASTADAAARAAAGGNPSYAAICSRQAARASGLEILACDIQNAASNRTRFIVISRRLCIPEGANKITLCFSLPHTTGTLHAVLSRFAIEGMNLTKLESCPIPGKSFEYDFYLDFSGNVRQPHTLELLAALSDELPRFSFLGNYTETDEALS